MCRRSSEPLKDSGPAYRRFAPALAAITALSCSDTAGPALPQLWPNLDGLDLVTEQIVIWREPGWEPSEQTTCRVAFPCQVARRCGHG
jgi:hypothetical protein